MRRNMGVKTWLYPEPVLMIATYDENGNIDIMNAAWGGILGENIIGICIDLSHKTADNLRISKALSVSPGIREYVTECDYAGIVSGKNEPDKALKSGFTFVKSEYVDAPVINELPLTFECRVLSYDENTEIMLAEIVNVSVDDSIMKDNHIDMNKYHPIVFDASNHKYISLGEETADAFREGLKLR